jgi:hypothetical protein
MALCGVVIHLCVDALSAEEDNFIFFFEKGFVVSEK